jgi:hypothetical protein
MTRTRSIWILLIAVLALVGAGCGGDDGGSSDGDSSDDAAEPLSEDDFVEQFDETCIDVNNEIEDLGQPSDNDELADLADEAQGIGSDGLDELRDITPPEDLQDDVNDLLDILQAQVDAYGDLAEAAGDDDDEAIADVQSELEDNHNDAQDIGEDLGLHCFDDEDSSDDFSDSSDFSDDFSSDFSDDFSDDFSSDFSDDFSSDFSDDTGAAVAPADAIPEYGSVGTLDDGADACYGGDYDACDQLYFNADPGSGYRDYGDSCGGRQPTGTGVLCTDAFG